MLDGAPLQSMARSQTAEEKARKKARLDLSMLSRSPEEIKLDEVCLADLGPTAIDDLTEENLAVFYMLQLTPESPTSGDEEYVLAYE